MVTYPDMSIIETALGYALFKSDGEGEHLILPQARNWCFYSLLTTGLRRFTHQPLPVPDDG